MFLGDFLRAGLARKHEREKTVPAEKRFDLDLTNVIWLDILDLSS